jgi:hypothetical protein
MLLVVRLTGGLSIDFSAVLNKELDQVEILLDNGHVQWRLACEYGSQARKRSLTLYDC